jgi:hypothetical protein
VDDQIQVVNKTLDQFLRTGVKFDLAIFVCSAWYVEPSDIAEAVKQSTLKQGLIACHSYYDESAASGSWFDGEMKFSFHDTEAGRFVDVVTPEKNYSHHDGSIFKSGVILTGSGSDQGFQCLCSNIRSNPHAHYGIFRCVWIESNVSPGRCSYDLLPLTTYDFPDWYYSVMDMVGGLSPIMIQAAPWFVTRVSVVNVAVDREVHAKLLTYATSSSLTVGNLRNIARRCVMYYSTMCGQVVPSERQVIAHLQDVMKSFNRANFWLPVLENRSLSYFEQNVEAHPASSPMTIFVILLIALLCVVGYIMLTSGKASKSMKKITDFAQKTYSEFFNSSDDGTQCIDIRDFPEDVAKPLSVPRIQPPVKPKQIDPKLSKLIHKKDSSVVDKKLGVDQLTLTFTEQHHNLTLLGLYDNRYIPARIGRSADGLENAIVSRVCIKDLPSYKPKFVSDAQKAAFADKKFINYINALIAHCKESSVSEWLVSLKSTSKRMYEQKAQQGIVLETTRDGIQKGEKAISVVDGEMVPQNDRLVSGVNDYPLHDLVGPFIKDLQEANREVVLEALQNGTLEDLPFVSTCGLNPVEIGAIFHYLTSGEVLKSAYTFYRSEDMSGFDGHITPAWLRCEADTYDLLGLDRAAHSVVAEQGSAFIKDTASLVSGWKMKGRNSGDSNTGFGNTIINFIAHRYAYAESLSDCIFVIYSDDAVVLSRKPIPNVDARFARVNMAAKHVDSKEVGLITMLSGKLMPAMVDGNPSLVLTPLLGKCLPKLFWAETERGIDAEARLRVLIKAGLAIFKADSRVTNLLRAYEAVLPPLPVESTGPCPVQLPWYFQQYFSILDSADIDPIEDVGEQFNTARYGPGFTHEMDETITLLNPKAGPVHFSLPSLAYEVDNTL